MTDQTLKTGQRIKDATGRWATVIEQVDNVITVDKFWKFVHIDNVIEIR